MIWEIEYYEWYEKIELWMIWESRILWMIWENRIMNDMRIYNYVWTMNICISYENHEQIKNPHQKRRYYCRRRPKKEITRKCVIFMEIHENHQTSTYKEKILLPQAPEKLFRTQKCWFFMKFHENH